MQSQRGCLSKGVLPQGCPARMTHLPQLAAMADTHFGVEKGEENGRTLTKVVSLDRAARRSEIARLSGGDHPSETMIAGAEELLCAAEQYKNQLL